MIKAPVVLQDLRRKIYAKAKADGSWRFWGLYVHVCKMETLRTAFERAKDNDGAPGIDGVTFAAIEEQGVESFLEQIRDELTRRTYKPMRVRKREIPKGACQNRQERFKKREGTSSLETATHFKHFSYVERFLQGYLHCFCKRSECTVLLSVHEAVKWTLLEGWR